MKVELEAHFFPLMQSRYEFPLSLDIQGQLMGAKRSKSGKNRFLFFFFFFFFFFNYLFFTARILTLLITKNYI